MFDQCFSKWMIAGDEIFVSPMKAFKVAGIGYQIELPSLAPIARRTGEYEVPDLIETRDDSAALKDVWQEVVHVRGFGGVDVEADRRKAIKAAALLVSVQCVTRACDASSTACRLEGLRNGVIFNEGATE